MKKSEKEQARLLDCEPENVEPIASIFFETIPGDELQWPENEAEILQIFRNDIKEALGPKSVPEQFFNWNKEVGSYNHEDYFSALKFYLLAEDVYIYESDTRFSIYMESSIDNHKPRLCKDGEQPDIIVTIERETFETVELKIMADEECDALGYALNQAKNNDNLEWAQSDIIGDYTILNEEMPES